MNLNLNEQERLILINCIQESMNNKIHSLRDDYNFYIQDNAMKSELEFLINYTEVIEAICLGNELDSDMVLDCISDYFESREDSEIDEFNSNDLATFTILKSIKENIESLSETKEEEDEEEIDYEATKERIRNFLNNSEEYKEMIKKDLFDVRRPKDSCTVTDGAFELLYKAEFNTDGEVHDIIIEVAEEIMEEMEDLIWEVLKKDEEEING